MMKSNLKFEYNKLSMLTKIEMKRIINQLSNIVLLALLLILFVNMFIFISKNNGIKIQTKVALSIEDNSFEVNTLMKNITENKLKNIVEFEETNLDNGLKLLKNNEVVALIHVDEGTTELLNYGKAASLNLYVGNTSNIAVKFLINYLKNLVKVLNEGQSGAMIYWDIMKANGFNFDGRIKELNKIALNYMSVFLTRGGVFEESKDLDKFYGASLISYYFSASLLIISIISAVMFHLDIDDDFKKGRIRRALSSGVNLLHIYCAKIIAGVTFSTVLLIIFKAIYMVSFDALSIGKLLKFITYFTLTNVIIHMIVIIFYVLISNDIVRDSCFVMFFLILSLASGIILPLTSMNKIFAALSRFNILAIGHNLLLGYSLSIGSILIILFYFLILIISIYYAHKKRGV
ncbi:ABC transporter permease [Paramaledivibacter caminithermalis]|nr:ABC transporter permease [Paramaledivibacter caminithermalis]